MTIDQNTLRRLNKLWKDRHGHSEDTTAAELVEIRETISVGTGAVVSPAYIHLTHNAGQTIAVAGEAISWDTQHSLIDPVGFADPADAGTDNLPLTTVVVPYDGYYGVKIELDWDTHTSGGTVEIRRTRNDGNAARLWPTDDDPGIWTATDGQRFSDIAVIPAIVGDKLSVYVDHDAGATKDLSTAQVIFYKVESSTVVRALYKAAVLASGPRAYWRLDETSGTNADDIAGHSAGPFDATYVATPTLDETGVMKDGSGNGSVLLNGSTQYLTVPLSTVDGVGASSVEGWFNLDTTGTQALFAVNDEDATAGNRWLVWIGTSVSYEQEGDTILDGAANTLAADTDHYVAVTRAASGLVTIYVDGVFDVSTTFGSLVTAATGDLVQIGAEYDIGPLTLGNFLDGHVDEVAFYDRVLTADEVLEHYNIGRGAFL